MSHQPVLLIVTVAVVGVMHTIVPDHWAPIVVLARQQGWSLVRTARSAALAGLGHVVTTLALGALVWIVGASLAARYAHWVSFASALALLAFGLWIGLGAWKEARAGRDGQPVFGHAHLHRHEEGLEHIHWHEQTQDGRFANESDAAVRRSRKRMRPAFTWARQQLPATD